MYGPAGPGIASSTRKVQSHHHSLLSRSHHRSAHGPDPDAPNRPIPVGDLDAAVPASTRRPLPRLPPMARLHWLEAMLPLGIIGGMLCIMGNAQYYIHRAAHGRVTLPAPLFPILLPVRIPSCGRSRFSSLCVWLQPKHIGNDMWDVAMERRDKKLVEQASGN